MSIKWISRGPSIPVLNNHSRLLSLPFSQFVAETEKRVATLSRFPHLLDSSSNSDCSEGARLEGREEWHNNSGAREEEGFRKWVKNCSTPAQAREAWRSTSVSEREDLAFERWLEVCTTPSEVREAWRSTSVSSCEDAAFDRWLELCSTSEEAREAYRATSDQRCEERAKARIRELGGEV